MVNDRSERARGGKILELHIDFSSPLSPNNDRGRHR